jgi:predicted DNA-binding protein
MSKLQEKKQPKNKSVSTKITESQNEKLDLLAKKLGITKSNLMNQLIALGYQTATKTKRDF